MGMDRRTTVSIHGPDFLINGCLTYEGRYWHDNRIEGLLLNARLVQGIFDDLNHKTRNLWAYPDTNVWDPERNTDEFVAAMPRWRSHGLLCFTLNLQGGSPQGYSKTQPWHNSAITADGELRADYVARLERILTAADEQGMVVILGVFYFGQDHHLRDEAAVFRAVDNTVGWLFENEFGNVLLEINNECNIQYHHRMLQPDRVHELIERAQSMRHNGRRILVSTSYGGNTIPLPNVVRVADFALLHGNGVDEPRRIAEMVRQTRQVDGYRPMPILFNEDDHFDFGKTDNNMVAAISEYASWGYFDYRFDGEAFQQGYQSVPVDWRIGSERKRSFFELVRDITGQ
jgi:hypothetical protein